MAPTVKTKNVNVSQKDEQTNDIHKQTSIASVVSQSKTDLTNNSEKNC